MIYKFCPTAFKVAHWRCFYDSVIPTLDVARTLADDALFVVVDAEPSSNDNIQGSEFGISILRITGAPSMWPTTLDDFVETFTVETHCIQVIGKPRHRRCETHRFGQKHTVGIEDVEKYIISLIESYKERNPITPKHLILVGFDLLFEFQMLSSTFHKFPNYFSSWFDTQELARLASGVDKPGLSATFAACGFGTCDSRDLHSLCGRHNAATDTVRTAAVFTYLLSKSGDQPLKIETSNRNASLLNRKLRSLPSNTPEERKLWKGRRPAPKELYPYIAKIKCSNGATMPPAAVLFDIFTDHGLVAAATAGGNRYGWVCLPSVERLNEFIGAVHMSPNQKQGKWLVVSEYDPSVVPAQNMQEINQMIHARAEEKREERRLKRLVVLGDDCDSREL